MRCEIFTDATGKTANFDGRLDVELTSREFRYFSKAIATALLYVRATFHEVKCLDERDVAGCAVS